ncbi:MAG TPA: hypothetical protein VMV44_08125 [Rectinemataceae bacterium]|nr:hypothetical protein [Rectinemataceae bacterium]
MGEFLESLKGDYPAGTVDEKTVRNVKGESTADIPQSTKTQGRDGRTINTANIGKARAPAPVVNEMPLESTFEVVPQRTTTSIHG